MDNPLDCSKAAIRSSTEILAWHFLPDNGMTAAHMDRPAVLVEVGQTLVEDRPLVLCMVGLHGSVKPLDALQYAPGAVIQRTRHHGTILQDKDKLCSSHRTCLVKADATIVLHEFACWCTEQALEQERAAGREPDPRSWAAVDAKRAWLQDEISRDQLAAACDAAKSAATAAACNAAKSAATAAAKSAATAAAWAADWAAAWAAKSAATAAWAAKSGANDAAWAAWAACDAANAAACAASCAAASEARITAELQSNEDVWDTAVAASMDKQNAELERRLLLLISTQPQANVASTL